jgi:hypothetical protein
MEDENKVLLEKNESEEIFLTRNIFFIIFFIILLLISNSLSTHIQDKKEQEPLFIITTEFSKIIITLFLLFFEIFREKKSFNDTLDTLRSNFKSSFHNCLWFLIPAFVYSLYNHILIYQLNDSANNVKKTF